MHSHSHQHDHDHHRHRQIGGSDDSRYRETRNVTLMAACSNLFLTAAQIIIGVVSHSQALIADGIHTLSDFVADIIVLIAARYANNAADADHPYGHARIETLATLVLGAFLAAIGVGIGVDSITRLLDPTKMLMPEKLALVASFITLIAKEAMYQYTMVIARKLNSDMLKANAWHHRSDAISSLIVFGAIAGSQFGIPHLDAIAAIVVGVMIGRMGWILARDSLSELIDTGLQPHQVDEIKLVISRVEGVEALHMLRSRKMAGKGVVDVHLLVNAKLSVSEGHQIGESVRETLHDQLDFIDDVTVHIDPEDDENSRPCHDLPCRSAVLKQLWQAWEILGVKKDIDRVVLHYLNGSIHVELYVPLQNLENISSVQLFSDTISARTREVANIGEVQLFFF